MNIKNLLKSRKGIGIAEVIAASAIFMIIFTAILAAIQVNDSSFVLKMREGNMAATYSETYGYLYTYKKNYGTSMVKNLLTLNNQSCTKKVNSADTSAGKWCVVYPYLDGQEIKFAQGDPELDPMAESDPTDGSQTFFKNTEINGSLYSYLKSNKVFGPTKQIILYVREDRDLSGVIIDEDKLFFRFRIVDISDSLLPTSKIYVNFDQEFQLY